MNVGFMQMTPVWGDIQKNLETVERLSKGISADLIVLPEFFNTGYLFGSRSEVADLAESIPDGNTCRFLLDISRAHNCVYVAGLPERDGDTFYNASVTATPDGKVFLYRKTHLFDREKLFFSPGNTGFRVFQVNETTLGMMICFDWIFPEACRKLALSGAQIIAHPANLVLPYCPTAMVTRCLENRVFAITSNRSGSEHRHGMTLNYIGNSRIISPSGEILAAAGDEKELVSVVSINPEIAKNKNITPKNDLFLDRREEFY